MGGRHRRWRLRGRAGCGRVGRRRRWVIDEHGYSAFVGTAGLIENYHAQGIGTVRLLASIPLGQRATFNQAVNGTCHWPKGLRAPAHTILNRVVREIGGQRNPLDRDDTLNRLAISRPRNE